MPENSTPTRDAKLVQYLNEAYALERRLETALQAHIGLAERDAYKKRLQEHLRETKQQAKNLERRIKALGGKAVQVDLPGPDIASQAVGVAAAAAQKGMALAQGPAHALRGMSSEETQLKNAKTEFSDEHEEIATYEGIEALATALGDKETAQLAREHRRQEERMASFLSKQIAQLAKAVATKEVPAAERLALARDGEQAARDGEQGAQHREEGGRHDAQHREEGGRLHAQHGEEGGRLHAQHGQEGGRLHAQHGEEGDALARQELGLPQQERQLALTRLPGHG